jgi:ATP-dependent HslUV protease, peptidase subunit HslV
MTTLAVARKNGFVAIAADSQTTFGDMRLSAPYKREHDKILQVGESWIGVCGSSAHHLVLASAFRELGEVDLSSRAAVFDTFRRLHPVLKEHAYLNPKEDDDDPYESSQISCLIANASGIYAVYSYREVFAFERFWAAGSGRNFALGAMYAAYNSQILTEDIAKLGVRAGMEFDTASGGPIVSYAMALDMNNGA